MNRNRKTAIIVGVLFITATVASVLGTLFSKPILDAPDYLIDISANGNQVTIGALLAFIAALASASIAISLYPILRKYNEGLALGAVGFRLIEAVFIIARVMGLLLLLTLSQEFVKAGAPDSSYFQTSGVLIVAGRDWMGNVGSLLPFGLGALMYYYIFFQTKLVPRWLSGWGLIGTILIIVTSMLVMFRVIGPMSTTQVVLAVPIGLQEMVLAVWLIVKGFNPSVIASGSAETEKL
jgi:hypothetical protein